MWVGVGVRFRRRIWGKFLGDRDGGLKGVWRPRVEGGKVGRGLWC
jgi:hypothetical protein